MSILLIAFSSVGLSQSKLITKYDSLPMIAGSIPDNPNIIKNQSLEKQQIRSVIDRWAFSRDKGQWVALANCFHPDGSILISWYSGNYKGFIDLSKQMGRTKHVMYNTIIELNNHRAISETNASIHARVEKFSFEADLTTYVRFLDFFVKKAGQWRISKRIGIYEKDRLDLVEPSLLGSLFKRFMRVKQYPKACRFLCYGMTKMGYSIMPDMVIANSVEEHDLFKEAAKWLNEE